MHCSWPEPSRTGPDHTSAGRAPGRDLDKLDRPAGRSPAGRDQCDQRCWC